MSDWDTEYDVIILGTGLKECILGGLMSSVLNKKILQLDCNNYYGGENASLNLQSLMDQYGNVQDGKVDRKRMGAPRDYNIDLCPKFLLSDGALVKMLVGCHVDPYIEFKGVMGSYVYHKKKLHKVPSTAGEGLSSGLLSMFQKIRFRSFINYVDAYKANDRSTHGGLDLTTMTMAQVYKHFSLDKIGQTFVSHALALEADNGHLSRPAQPIIEKIKVYAYSVSRYGNSPYIYPRYGLGNIPEAFTRLCAIHNGCFILNSDVKGIRYGDDGKVVGITLSHEQINDGKDSVANAPIIIAAPNFVAANDTKSVGQVARCVVVMSAPIANTNEQGNGQIIIPNVEVKRASDIYVSCLSSEHDVAPRGKFLAVMSTTVEGGTVDTNDKKAVAAACDRELKHALALVPRNTVLDKFTWITNMKAPADEGALHAKGLFVTNSSDATTHFQTDTAEVLRLYAAINGSPLDINNMAQKEQEKKQ